MSDIVSIEKYDEVYLTVKADRGILREISEEFTFLVPGYKFTPAFKKGWDGKIRLFDMKTQSLYVGLLKYLVIFCKEREYDIQIDYREFASEEVSEVEMLQFVKDIVSESKIKDFEVREYQYETFLHCVRNKRALFLSPTSSGKSFMIYLLARWYDLPTLLIVDGTAPVDQMAEDFEQYGYDSDKIHKIFGGVDKSVIKPITISTWQSLQGIDAEWFSRFGLIIGDEAHHFQAKSFMNLMHKTVETEYKFGFTGTITDSKTSKLVLEGLFGPVKQIVTTKQLQESGYIAELKIKCLILHYSDEEKKKIAGSSYQEEMDFLSRSSKRNKFLLNLALSQKKNTVLFFQYVEKHGKVLYDLIKEADPDRKIFFIHGGVDGSIRNEMRAEIEQCENAIMVASYGSFSTAISIKNIHSIIFGSPTKSKIRNLQSIGRVLRMHHAKDYATLFDISDNLIWKKKKNYTIGHFIERTKIYDSENFDYKIYNIELEN